MGSRTGIRRAARATGRRGTAAVANVVDYKLTPKRLQPGYERQVSRKSLAWAYAAFAAGLAAGAYLRER